jgi:antitoxin component of MazEF toxin-antitoxin module
MIIMRNMHVVRPYKVGAKTGKSIAVIIPSEIVKQYGINPSSVIILKSDPIAKKITLEAMKEEEGTERLEIIGSIGEQL